MAYLELSEEIRAVAERVLTAKQLTVFRLRFSRVSWDSIADQMGLDPTTVRGHYKAALRRLEKQPEIQEIEKARAA